MWASYWRGFSCCRAQALGTRASVVVACRLSCSMAYGIFLDQVLNQCPRHWQADSQPLDHQGCLRALVVMHLSRLNTGALVSRVCGGWKACCEEYIPIECGRKSHSQTTLVWIPAQPFITRTSYLMFLCLFPFPPCEEGNLYERRLLRDLPHTVVVRDNVVGKN